MTDTPDPIADPAAILCDPLAAALDRGTPWCGAALEALRDTGLAHAHVRLVGFGALARIPKQSQMNLAPHDNLRYEAACFERAGPSGHTPRLLGVLPVSRELPHGALVVEEIAGVAAALPRDLSAIATALASIHRLALPGPAARAPLVADADPMTALLHEIEAQAADLGAARVAHGVSQSIGDEIERFRALCAHAPRPPRCLISFDAHPGNFILRADGSAVLVDLEKCRYSHASLDLAHATLYTSTTWDVASRATLTSVQVAQAYTDWSHAFGPQARALRAWHLPLRRAMWLWSVTWCAKWRVRSAAAPRPISNSGENGEDWSTALSDIALIDHVRERVDHYLSPHGVAHVSAEFDALSQALSRPL